MNKNISCLTLCIILGLCGFFAATPLFAQNYFLQVSNNSLTLKTENIPLQQVLSEIETQSKIRMRLFLKADDLVTAEFNDIPLEEGLDLLLQRYNHAITYRAMPNNVFAITDIFIHSRRIKADKTLHLILSGQQGDNQATTLTLEAPEPGEIALHNINPLNNDPLKSMRGIDPLARFDLPQLDHDPHSTGVPFLPTPGQLAAIH
ncbi:MAG: hypothetical protein ACI8ZB_000379 [Desulforhopalus sp.]|jgi:hypothetical protein